MDTYDHDTAPEQVFPTDSPIFFETREQPLFGRTPQGTYLASKTHKQIVRNTDGAVQELAIVGIDYGVVTMREQCDLIEDMMIKEFSTKELENVEVRDKVAYHGGTCLREYTFPNISVDVSSSPKLDDIVSFRCTMRGSYGRNSIAWQYGAMRLVCLNGMVVGEFEQGIKRHSKHVQIDDIAYRFRDAIDKFFAQSRRWRQWEQIIISHDDAEEFLINTIANDTKHNSLSRRLFEQYFEAAVMSHDGGNMWTLYNALTFYASHDEGQFATRNTANDHSAATMFDRGKQVRRWIESEQFRTLIAA